MVLEWEDICNNWFTYKASPSVALVETAQHLE